MTASEYNNTVIETKKVMNALMGCVKDQRLSKEERSQYYRDYKEVAAEYLKLQKNKPHLSIA